MGLYVNVKTNDIYIVSTFHCPYGYTQTSTSIHSTQCIEGQRHTDYAAEFTGMTLFVLIIFEDVTTTLHCFRMVSMASHIVKLRTNGNTPDLLANVSFSFLLLSFRFSLCHIVCARDLCTGDYIILKTYVYFHQQCNMLYEIHTVVLVDWILTPLSTVFQLQYGDQISHQQS